MSFLISTLVLCCDLLAFSVAIALAFAYIRGHAHNKLFESRILIGQCLNSWRVTLPSYTERIASSLDTLLFLITPRACARGKVIGRDVVVGDRRDATCLMWLCHYTSSLNLEPGDGYWRSKGAAKPRKQGKASRLRRSCKTSQMPRYV